MTNEEIEAGLQTPKETYLSTTWAEVNNGNLVLSFSDKTLKELKELGKKIDDQFKDDISSCIIAKPNEGDVYEIVIGSNTSLISVIILQELPLKYPSDLLKYQENSDQIGLIFKTTKTDVSEEYLLDIKSNLILENFETKKPNGGFRNAGE